VLGRPIVGLDLDKVRAMRAEGLGLRAIAECMGCSASLLGQRLRAETRDALLERIGSV
jgi:hypothetical protein